MSGMRDSRIGVPHDTNGRDEAMQRRAEAAEAENATLRKMLDTNLDAALDERVLRAEAECVRLRAELTEARKTIAWYADNSGGGSGFAASFLERFPERLAAEDS